MKRGQGIVVTDERGSLDSRFREAVSAIDAGDAAGLAGFLVAHPGLVGARLEAPGAWLTGKVGGALEGFFRDPYLLWFVAEDPVRNGTLPGNIAEVAQIIIDAAVRERVDSLPDQLEHALRLVCWSWIARESGVQIALIDVLIDAGASPDGTSAFEGRFGTHADAAVFNGNIAAAEHLLARGAAPTLSTALCLERWGDVDRLAADATLEDKQDAFVLAALRGKAEALRRMLVLGIPPTTVSAHNYAHATALHHAVSSGSLDAVTVLVEAGADLTRHDTLYDGTPLGWAEHCEQEQADETRAGKYAAIADYLRGKEGQR